MRRLASVCDRLQSWTRPFVTPQQRHAGQDQQILGKRKAVLETARNQAHRERGIWTIEMPSTASVRRSDDALRINCQTSDGRNAVAMMESTMGAEIVASAVFFDLGITDAITDKHRHYASSLVIPVATRST